MRLLPPISLRVSLVVTFIAGWTALPTQADESDRLVVQVADTATYVSIAKINLSVGAMSVEEGDLVGTYSIDVPLQKSKSEDGQITLPLRQPLATYLRDGGTLSGKGLSTKVIEDNQRKIKARFSDYDPQSKIGKIHLTIETSLRTMEFDSTYTVSGQDSPSGE